METPCLGTPAALREEGQWRTRGARGGDQHRISLWGEGVIGPQPNGKSGRPVPGPVLWCIPLFPTHSKRKFLNPFHLLNSARKGNLFRDLDIQGNFVFDTCKYLVLTGKVKLFIILIYISISLQFRGAKCLLMNHYGLLGEVMYKQHYLGGNHLC